jgi:biopolymer transport protein ExbD
MQINRPSRKKNRISLTPLIDVVFLLLVFFMLASTFLRYTGFDLAGGRSGAMRGADVGNLVIVRVMGGGNIDVNGSPAKLDELAGELQALMTEGGLKVAVKTLDGANVQDVVNVIEKVRIKSVHEVMVVK